MGVAATIAGLAAAAAGTGMSISANNAVTDKENQAITDQLALQNQYVAGSTKTFQDSLAQSDEPTAQKQITAGQDKYKAEYDKAGVIPTASSPAGDTQASRVLNDQAAQQIGASNEQRAALGGYTEWDLNQWIKNIQAQQAINFTNSIARAQESVLPYQLYDAQNSQNDVKSWGSIMSALGSVLGGVGGATGSSAAQFSQIPATTATTLGNQQKATKSLNDLISQYGVKTNDTTINEYSPLDWKA